VNYNFTVGIFFIFGFLVSLSHVCWSFMSRSFVHWHVVMHWNLSMLCFGAEDGGLVVCLPKVLDNRKVPSMV